MTLQIRPLDRVDAPLLKRIRIAALQDAPEKFGETLEQALTRSDQDWVEMTGAAHIAELDDGPVGMVFAFPDHAEPETGRLGGMWVAPHARGAGIGLALVETVRVWARASGKNRVRLWVEPRTQAEKLYRRASFVATGTQKPFPRDSSRIVIEMQLELEPGGQA